MPKNETVIQDQDTGPDAPVDTNSPDDASLEAHARFPGNENVDPDTDEGATEDEGTEGELLAGKFKSQDDLVKAYKELESKLGKPKGTAADPRKAASDALKSKGLDLAEYEVEYQDSGALSEESYTKLEKAGFNKDLVNSYLAGQQALGEKFAETVFEMAGGQEAYSELMVWAKENLPDTAKIAFNEAAKTGSLETVDLMIAGIVAKRDAAGGGSGPKALVHGDKSGSDSTGYNSVDEMVKDMADPKYVEGNPAFHKMVDRKLANAKF